ncbi:MAG TPA: hypothetical protein V6D05_08575 [Stenomitos sp.]
MNLQPRAASYRVLAALCYLPPVAVGVLVMPEYRGIRHLRYHALQSLLLVAASFGGAMLIGWLGALLGNLPWLGFFLLSFSGLLISIWMLGMVGLAVYAAVMAYQGKSTRFWGVDRYVRRLDRWVEKRFTTLPAAPAEPPKRRRRTGPRP